MKKIHMMLLIAAVASLPLPSFSADKVVAGSKPDLSLKLELENAIAKGLSWLAGKQKEGGFWSQTEYPALTGLALTAFQGDPSGYYKKKYEANVGKGYDYLMKNVKPDGGIYAKDLANYNTSVSMMALLMANK